MTGMPSLHMGTFTTTYSGHHEWYFSPSAIMTALELVSTISIETGPRTISQIWMICFLRAASPLASPSLARIFGFVVQPLTIPQAMYFLISSSFEESMKRGIARVAPSGGLGPGVLDR